MQGSFTYQNKLLMYLTALLFIVVFLIYLTENRAVNAAVRIYKLPHSLIVRPFP